MPSPLPASDSTGTEAPQAPNSSTASKRPRTTGSANGTENRRKDPKVSRACDVCKRKKIRCNGTFPCKNCARRKVPCAYDAKYGRGRPPTPPGSFSVSPRVQIIETPSRGPVSIVDESSQSYGTSSTLAQGGDAARNISNISPSRDLQEAEIDRDSEDQYFDPTSGLNFLHRAWSKLSTQTRKDTGASYGSAEVDTGKRQLLGSAGDRPFQDSSHVSLTSNLSFIPEEKMARQLLQFYFETCVVTYCMLHRPTVEAWMVAFLQDRRENRPIIHSLGNEKLAILLTSLAIATLRYEKIHGDASMSSVGEAEALTQSDRLFRMAQNLTDAETGFPRLESAQARLLQVLYLLQTGRMNKGWYTFGNVFHITLSLGMHRRRDYQRDMSFMSRRRLSFVSSECYKRTFWVAYTIDRYLSVVFGRPKLYQDEDINQDYPESVNDEDLTAQGVSVSEDSGDCQVDGLIAHCRIARIIGDISRRVYCVRDISPHDRLIAAQILLQELQDWRISLPPHLGIVKPSTLIPSFRRQSVALQLAYSHAIIHATRPFLLGDGSAENTVTVKCISAAKAALELVNKMAGDSTIFHSFWWTHYVTFCALAVVYVWGIQLARRPADQNDDQLYTKLFELAEKCRNHLRRATAGLPPNRRYDIVLEELRVEAKKRHNRTDELLQPINSGDGVDHIFFRNSDAIPSSFDSHFPHALSNNESIRQNIGFEGTFQFSDWLALDSSAFFPFPESESDPVSPPWLSVVP